MSMPCITTWKCDQQDIIAIADAYADLPGTALFIGGKTTILALFPGQSPFQVGAITFEGEQQMYHPTCVIIHERGETGLGEARLFGEKERRFKRRQTPFSVQAELNDRSDTEESYIAKVEEIKQEIAAGSVYQVNLSHRFDYAVRGDPFALFRYLVDRYPVPYAAYLKREDEAYLSLSPELFLKREGNSLISRPIKGTAPRRGDPHLDREHREQLLASEKERAELMMITDLVRNDMTRAAERKSVRVNYARELATYHDLYHMQAEIEGRVTGNDPFALIAPLFPAGSITGCPKQRVIELIRKLEGEPRGIYTGSIGYVMPDGDFQFNVAIRTGVWRDGLFSFRLGGAVLYDSDPEAEYEETLHKGRKFFEALS